MEEIIHFRSRFAHEKGIGSASRHTLGRSSETSEIRLLGDNDDARDIVWKKSTGSNIYTRNRLVNPCIDISLVYHEGTYDRIKNTYIQQIKKYIESSCISSGDHFSYTYFGKNGDLKTGLKRTNSLVFIVSSSIEIEAYRELGKIYEGNDVIFLMLFQPIELEPIGHYIQESIIPNKKYYKEIHKRIRSIQKVIYSSRKSNILVRTDDNIVLKLNHFFKYRYG